MGYTPSIEERNTPEVMRLAERAHTDLEVSVFDCRAVIAWMLHESAYPEMKAALEEVMSWIANWDPIFTNDEFWPTTEAKITSALAKARGEA